VATGYRPSAAPLVPDDPTHSATTGLAGHTPRALSRWDTLEDSQIASLQALYRATLREATKQSVSMNPIHSLMSAGDSTRSRKRAPPGTPDASSPSAVAYTAQPDFFEVSSTVAPGRYAVAPPAAVVAALPADTGRELGTALSYRHRFRRALMLFNDKNVYVNR